MCADITSTVHGNAEHGFIVELTDGDRHLVCPGMFDDDSAALAAAHDKWNEGNDADQSTEQSKTGAAAAGGVEEPKLTLAPSDTVPAVPASGQDNMPNKLDDGTAAPGATGGTAPSAGQITTIAAIEDRPHAPPLSAAPAGQQLTQGDTPQNQAAVPGHETVAAVPASTADKLRATEEEPAPEKDGRGNE